MKEALLLAFVGRPRPRVAGDGVVPFAVAVDFALALESLVRGERIWDELGDVSLSFELGASDLRPRVDRR